MFPKLKYNNSPKKTKLENEQSEKVFRQSVKFILIEMLIGFIAGFIYPKGLILYPIMAIIIIITIQNVARNFVESGFHKKSEMAIYLAIGFGFSLFLATISSGIMMILNIIL